MLNNHSRIFIPSEFYILPRMLIDISKGNQYRNMNLYEKHLTRLKEKSINWKIDIDKNYS